jgi:hypothetical protein
MYTQTFSILVLVSVVSAHMHLYFPPTLKGDNNPHTQGDADPWLNYPYGCCGQESPGRCKGHLNLLNTDEGNSVTTWAAGQTANFTLSAAAIKTSDFNPQGSNHFGGSCQVGFSVNKGQTFKVATTWQGNCPLRNGGQDPSTQSFDFTVPADIPAGDAVFAWTWINREKEFFMNCATITITNGNHPPHEPPIITDSADISAQPTQYTLHKSVLHDIGKFDSRAETVPFNSRPDMLLDIDFSTTQCYFPSSDTELQFPDPGPDVVEGDGLYPLEQPSC